MISARVHWAKAIAIALAFTLCAIAVRWLLDYPRCQNDELNWVGIATHLDQGREWPVSGPGFVYILRSLKEVTQYAYTSVISGLGITSVFISVLLLVAAYDSVRITRPGITLLALALTGYYWAPLLEARPQQLGGILVFVGAFSAWRWLHGRGGWAFFAILATVSVSHILSHGILLWICTVLALSDYFENKPITRRHVILIASSLLSLVVYFIPSGPYQQTLKDLEFNHLHRLLTYAPYIGAAALCAVLAIVALQPKLHWRADWSVRTIRMALSHRRAICTLMVIALILLLSIQASILPSASWKPYEGSYARFLVFQLGNLFFAACFISGSFAFLRGITEHKIDTFSARFLVWSLLAIGLLGVIIVIASFRMLDTNWLLRLINYGVLFAGPIAALGLQQMVWLQRTPWLRLLLLPLLALSICHAIRPAGLLAC